MQSPNIDGIPALAGDKDKAYRTIAWEIASAIDQVRRTLKLIEQGIEDDISAEETPGGNVIVLDDVTPGYARAEVALRECDAGLSAALLLLPGPSASGSIAGQSTGEGQPSPARRPIFS